MFAIYMVRGMDDRKVVFKNLKGQIISINFVGSVPGTDHSKIYTFFLKIRLQAKMHLYACASVVFFAGVHIAGVDISTSAQL